MNLDPPRLYLIPLKLECLHLDINHELDFKISAILTFRFETIASKFSARTDLFSAVIGACNSVGL